MNGDLKQFIRQARSIGLSKEEKNTVKRSVLNFMAQNPVRLDIQPRLNYWSNIFLTKLSFSSTMAILLLLSVFVGGGVTFGAERALPGDILYPIKVGINEEVRGLISTSDEARANWEIKRTERRLEEAEELAVEGSLDSEVSENIEARFEAHAQRVQERVEKFKNKENFNAAASVSLNFEAALKAHERILSKLAQKKGDVEVQIKPIRAKIRSEFKESVQQRKRINIETMGETNGSVKIGSEDENIDSDINFETDIESNINSDADSVKTESGSRLKLGL